MEFRILGPLEVVDADRPLALGGERQRALLSAAAHPRERGRLDRPPRSTSSGECGRPKKALNTIQYYISQFRKTLGADRIVTLPAAPGYMIRVERA